MPNRPGNPPKGWEQDQLSVHFETAYRNRWATFANKRPAFQLLSRVDQAFVKASEKWTNPKSQGAALLLIRAHGYYRAACEHACAGQFPDAFAQLRLCLESAAYALHVAKNPGTDRIWINRHDDETTAKACKNEFKISNVRATIERVNKQAAADFDELCNWAIDYGGHPNERAITSTLSLTEEPGLRRVDQMLIAGDSPRLDAVLRATAETGLCALEILQDACLERFELLGVREAVLQLRREIRRRP